MPSNSPKFSHQTFSHFLALFLSNQTDFPNLTILSSRIMKKPGLFAASVAAASATAISASSSGFICDSKIQFSHEEAVSRKDRENSSSQRSSSSSTDQFAPRFDGLRFIETLITGHR